MLNAGWTELVLGQRSPVSLRLEILAVSGDYWAQARPMKSGMKTVWC
jgi:hypothetical protein